jgi:hypothetical protein
MGYTHYWRPQRQFTDLEWTEISSKAIKLVTDSEIPVQLEDNNPRPPRIDEGVILFNGVGDDGHEPFFLEKDRLVGFEFCKTARKPYDTLVCATLLISHKVAPDALDIASDGYAEEWLPTRDLLKKIFGEDFPLPNGLEPAPAERRL